MSSHRKHILIVHWDDDQLIALERFLENQGFETTTTWNLQEGLDLLRGRRFDLVIVADHEPDVDAGEVLRALQSQSPCIVLRNGGRCDPEYFLTLGAKAVLFPWERESLTRLVKEALGYTQAAARGMAAD